MSSASTPWAQTETFSGFLFPPWPRPSWARRKERTGGGGGGWEPMDERARERGARDGRAAAAGSECVILSANFTYTLTNLSQFIRLELGVFFYFYFSLFLFPSPPGMRTCSPFFGDDLSTSNPVFFFWGSLNLMFPTGSCLRLTVPTTHVPSFAPLCLPLAYCLAHQSKAANLPNASRLSVNKKL